MRVLHLVKTPLGATWAFRLMRELVSLGVEVHVVLPPEANLLTSYRKAGVRVHEFESDFPLKKPLMIGSTLRSLRQVVGSVNPDLIHSHFVGTTLSIRLALGKGHPIPRIFQVPGPLHLEHTFFRFAELAIAGRQDFWIGSCEWTCERYRRSGISNERVFLAYYGVDIERYRENRSDALRKELGLKPETPLIGMVAYMYAPKKILGQRRGLKGHEDLIDAMVLVRSQYDDARVVFVGGSWVGAEDYERRVKRYGELRLGDAAVFLGTRDDVPALYPDFDVAVHPSHSENVGGACGSLLSAVPTVATDVGGFPDVVIPGSTGWLVPPRRPDELASAILRVLADRGGARAMARRGQGHVRSLMDVRKTAADVLGVYRSILNKAEDINGAV
jgi:glycosyltransferase involved in cell wall biosynthesis